VLERGREELLNEPELDSMVGVLHDGKHHDVQHAFVKMAGGDGEDVDIGLRLCRFRTGEELGALLENLLAVEIESDLAEKLVD
nr:hypothetical protein [Tanacetum cinerariifolium]